MTTEILNCPLCGSTNSSAHVSAPDRFHLRTEVYDLRRCADCMGVWLPHPPTPEQMALHYDEDYHKVISQSGETAASSRWQRQRELIGNHKSGGNLLDIGCSSGAFLGTMRNERWNLFGIEMASSTAEKARKATGAEVFVGDAMNAPFPAGSFDVVTCFDVLEHVYEPRPFLEKIHHWLKPSGIFFTVLPNIDSWESKLFRSYWYGLELPRHLFHFSPKSLRSVMKTMGFTEVHLKTPSICYVERSADYVTSSIVAKFGFVPKAQSKPQEKSFAWKVVRKGLRMTVVAPFAISASAAGAGGSMEAIFQKPAGSTV